MIVVKVVHKAIIEIVRTVGRNYPLLGIEATETEIDRDQSNKSNNSRTEVDIIYERQHIVFFVSIFVLHIIILYVYF